MRGARPERNRSHSGRDITAFAILLNIDQAEIRRHVVTTPRNQHFHLLPPAVDHSSSSSISYFRSASRVVHLPSEHDRVLPTSSLCSLIPLRDGEIENNYRVPGLRGFSVSAVRWSACHHVHHRELRSPAWLHFQAAIP